MVNNARRELLVGLAGALVGELALAGPVDLSGKRFIAVGRPPGDPLMAAAHQALAQSTGQQTAAQLRGLDKGIGGVWSRLVDGLADRPPPSRQRSKAVRPPGGRAEGRVFLPPAARAAGDSRRDSHCSASLEVERVSRPGRPDPEPLTRTAAPLRRAGARTAFPPGQKVLTATELLPPDGRCHACTGIHLPSTKGPAGRSSFAGIARISSLGAPFILSAVRPLSLSSRLRVSPALRSVQLPQEPGSWTDNRASEFPELCRCDRRRL